MTYDIVHTTRYEYSESVSVSHHIAQLSPRTCEYQVCADHELAVEPSPAVTATHSDYFGNSVTFLAMQGGHKRLTVRARSKVTLRPREMLRPWDTPSWELLLDPSTLPLDALEAVFDPPSLRTSSDLASYARPSFAAGRPLLEAVIDLTQRIHADFTFDPTATTVTTSVADVLESRRGVCQDFARLEIACLRSLGLPARYVSGYLETVPPPGVPKLRGADVSHAWLAVFCPGIGWIDVDPTNNLLPSDTHITLGWGRDYSDVSPIRGVILGGGAHTLRVTVDVTRVQEAL